MRPNRRRPRRLLLAGGVVAATAVDTVSVLSAGAATTGRSVGYTVGSQWAGGLTASVALTNLAGAAVS